MILCIYRLTNNLPTPIKQKHSIFRYGNLYTMIFFQLYLFVCFTYLTNNCICGKHTVNTKMKILA